jgi:hypothetical protein
MTKTASVGVTWCIRSMSPERREAMGHIAQVTVDRHASVDSVLSGLVALYRGSPVTETHASLPIRETARP